MAPDDERNAAILRRTLSAISWLYALWSGMLGAITGAGSLPAKLLIAHGALLGMAGTLLWKPRRAAVPVTLLAAAGSIFFVLYDLKLGNSQAAFIDGGYVVVALALLYKSRPRT
jgi:uncharacterized membrane protein